MTVCHISQNCQNWQGDHILVSPASLEKLPIVIALMEKVTQEQIKLDSPIFVDPGNYTEDGSDIQVRKSYPLGFLALRIINQSSNIAANQLIDYLGQDYINQVLRDRGYQSSYVGHKFIGDKTYPRHPGCCSNRLTTNEITKMMLQIYQRQHIGDQIIAKSLAFQTDHTFAYRVVKQQPIRWLGEKTGWHSKFLGTTVATKIGDDIYIMTVVINQGNQKSLVRQVIRKMGQHILDHGFKGERKKIEEKG